MRGGRDGYTLIETLAATLLLVSAALVIMDGLTLGRGEALRGTAEEAARSLAQSEAERIRSVPPWSVPGRTRVELDASGEAGVGGGYRLEVDREIRCEGGEMFADNDRALLAAPDCSERSPLAHFTIRVLYLAVPPAEGWDTVAVRSSAGPIGRYSPVDP